MKLPIVHRSSGILNLNENESLVCSIFDWFVPWIYLPKFPSTRFHYEPGVILFAEYLVTLVVACFKHRNLKVTGSFHDQVLLEPNQRYGHSLLRISLNFSDACPH